MNFLYISQVRLSYVNFMAQIRPFQNPYSTAYTNKVVAEYTRRTSIFTRSFVVLSAQLLLFIYQKPFKDILLI